MPINIACEAGVWLCHAATGIVYATMNGADVINASFGAYWHSQTEELAIQAALDAGALVVAGAGNEGINADKDPFYPASLPQTLGVGGTYKNSDVNAWNYGQSVNVFAPSVSIDATYPLNAYTWVRGTSFATPLVSGVAALVRTAFPHYSPEQVRKQIRLTAVNIDAANPGLEGKMGRGRVDAHAAVTAAPLPAIRVASWSYENQHGTQDVATGDTVSLTATFKNFHGSGQSISAELTADGDYVSWHTQHVVLGAMDHGESRDATFSFTISGPAFNNEVRLTSTITAGTLTDKPDLLRFKVIPPIAHAPDSLALVALYNATGGESWSYNNNWLVPGERVSSWWGLVLAGSRVGRISLGNNNLLGQLPAEIDVWTELKWLSLPFNQLSGPIPPEFGMLAGLERLWLYGNQLSGPTPPELGTLTNLEQLYLNDNNLSGSVPAQLGSLDELTHLDLNRNKLTGPLPLELRNLTQLQTRSFQQGSDVVNALCAPQDAAFQAWLQSLDNVEGPDCAPSVAVEEAELPLEFVLHGNYPNPFRRTTQISFDLPPSASVAVQLFDVIGRKVLTSAPVVTRPGRNRLIKLDTAQLGSGHYFYRLEAEFETGVEFHVGKLTVIH